MDVVIGCWVIMAGYFIPVFAAWHRGHRDLLAISALNTLLGWTILGWVVALVWALMNPPEVKGALNA